MDTNSSRDIPRKWQSTVTRVQLAANPSIANVTRLCTISDRTREAGLSRFNSVPLVQTQSMNVFNLSQEDCHEESSDEDEGEKSTTSLMLHRLYMARAKLEATSVTSEILSAFALITMVELQINDPTEVPEWLFVLFSVSTTVLVTVHVFALTICVYLLPSIDAVSETKSSKLIKESPHEELKWLIEVAWILSHVLGLFLFLIHLSILCWVKFYDYSFSAPLTATILLIPVLIIFTGFAIYFYHSLVAIKWKTSQSNLEELERIRHSLDSVV